MLTNAALSQIARPRSATTNPMSVASYFQYGDAHWIQLSSESRCCVQRANDLPPHHDGGGANRKMTQA
jgi:hypothetical protein